MDQKWMSVWYPGVPFGSLFRDLFRTSSFGCILVDPWLTFGTLWTPIGSLLAPFASLLAPFDSLLAPLVSLLAPFGSLLAPFRHPPGSFSHFWQHFGFALAFFTFFGSKFAPKWSFMRIFEQNIFLWTNPSAKKRGLPHAPTPRVSRVQKKRRKSGGGNAALPRTR